MQKALEALRAQINLLPVTDRRNLIPLIDAADEARARRQKLLGTIQEGLSELRLSVKYLTYDLHCTRQERDTVI